MALATGAALAGFVFYNKKEPERYADQVLAALAGDHALRKAPEVETDRYADIERELGTRLQLGMNEAAYELEPNFALMGLSYATVMGEPAAALKVIDRATEFPGTLYVTGLTEELKVLCPSQARKDGVSLTLWTDGQRFFALATQGH